MRIAFYAPLKSPDHPIPSGDRQMARMLISALRAARHEVGTVSHLRCFLPDPAEDRLDRLEIEAEGERAKLTALWAAGGRPDLWFCYHPYYKSPDLLGPVLARAHGLAYVTAEASYSARRNSGAWARAQAAVANAVQQAEINFCFTTRDRQGLQEAIPAARLAMIAPYIDAERFRDGEPQDNAQRLIVVAMMRQGDKLDSYAMLAEALHLVLDCSWTLAIAGDGDARDEVRGFFQGIPADRVTWLGVVEPSEIAALFRAGGIYVWPGCGEAYGLAYLEAQAAGLPVVAQHTAGVPEVVVHGRTGILTPEGDIAAFANAIRRLLTDGEERRRMGRAARMQVFEKHSLAAATATLDAALKLVEARRR